jgi:hypothetical protein
VGCVAALYSGTLLRNCRCGHARFARVNSSLDLARVRARTRTRCDDSLRSGFAEQRRAVASLQSRDAQNHARNLTFHGGNLSTCGTRARAIVQALIACGAKRATFCEQPRVSFLPSFARCCLAVTSRDGVPRAHHDDECVAVRGARGTTTDGRARREAAREHPTASAARPASTRWPARRKRAAGVTGPAPLPMLQDGAEGFGYDYSTFPASAADRLRCAPP